MFITRLLTSFLGLAALAVPASATTLTFYSDPNLFNSATTSLFFPDPLTSFNPVYLSGTEYDDPGTLASFFGFSNPTTPAAVTVVGTQLQPTVPGGLVEITLPAAVYAFAANLTVPSGFGNFCFEVHSTFNTGPNCDDTIYVPSGSNTFVGVVSSTAFNTIWIGPNGGAPILSMVNFEVGEQAPPPATPEVATALLIGSGLILMSVLRRRLRLRLAI